MEDLGLILGYEDAATVMRQMLAAAKQQDWDTLTELEHDYMQQVNRLKQQERQQLLPEAVRLRKAEIIQGMLDDDKEIRSLIHPWMAQLAKLMNGTQTQTQLNRSYGVQ